MSESSDTERSLKNGGQFVGPISDGFYKLFTSPETVSSLLARDPTISPGDAWHTLYRNHIGGKLSGPNSIHHAGKHTPTSEDLQKAASCGRWGPTQPSELFLTVSDHMSPETIFDRRDTDVTRCTMMLSTRLKRMHPMLL